MHHKFRIRTYNDDYQVIKLEKKVKELRKGYKLSTRLTKAETEKIILGDIQFLKDKEDALLREFYIKYKTNPLQPKTIIIYEREAYKFSPGNTRITLDFNNRTNINSVDFFNQNQSYFEIEPISVFLK
ncbi:MAG: VTC domain-containing protein [Eubacteriales bacterium]